MCEDAQSTLLFFSCYYDFLLITCSEQAGGSQITWKTPQSLSLLEKM